MYLSKADIENTERIQRLNIINSISGIKPGNLIGTRSNEGQANLAIISSVIHLGSNPAYLGFIVRPEWRRKEGIRKKILLKMAGSRSIISELNSLKMRITPPPSLIITFPNLIVVG